MPQRNVNLTDHFDQFIDATIASGRFSNASEIVREALRLLEQREREDEAKLKWLQGAAKEGFDAIEQGDYVSLDSREALNAFLKGIHKEIAPEPTVDDSRG